MEKIKVAIIGSRGYPVVYSGYETLVKYLAEGLQKKNIDINVYCHSSLFKQKPKIVNGINLIYTPSITKKNLSQLYNSFFSTIHACIFKTDVIVFVNVSNSFFGLITKMFRVKTIINVDGVEWKRPKWGFFGKLYFYLSSKICKYLIDQIITDSKSMQKIYLEKLKTKSTVIKYGPLLKSDNNSNILDEFNLLKFKYFLVIGRLIPDNNSDIIIESFSNIDSVYKLVIVGDVPYKSRFSKKVKKYISNNIIFTGYINDESDLEKLYRNAFFYIHAHEFGGTNPTLVNAVYLKCPVIALGVEFNREVLRGKFKKIFFKKTKSDLTNIIKKVIADESINNEIRSSYKKTELKNEYKWENIIDKYNTVINFLANK